MTDSALTKLCLEAMGWKHLGAVGIEPPKRGEPDPKGLWCLSGGNDWWLDPEGRHVCAPCSGLPDPLHDDAHAMALLKRFKLDIWPPFDLEDDPDQEWGVSSSDNRAGPADVLNRDLNRAIVECVAALQEGAASNYTKQRG